MDSDRIAYLLILSLVFARSGLGLTQAQSQYSLDLKLLTWDHSTIGVLMTPPNNASWWNPSYLNATLRAISQWNHAILDFASNYTDYEWLLSLRMTQTIAPTDKSGLDVFISWTEKPPSNANEIGLTGYVYEWPSRILVDSSIYLSSKTFQGYVLSEADMQNVALHELGHSLGLGHSNYAGDTMYPELTTLQSLVPRVQALSTLDLYGVSTVFQWMSNSSPPYRPQQSSVTLPPSIAYQYLPISNTDLPLSQLLLTFIQNLVSSLTNLIRRPLTVILTVATGVILLVTILILAGRLLKPKKNR